MTDKELINKLVAAYKCKNLTELCNKLNLSYPTVSGWHSKNFIPTSRNYNKEYLELLIEKKKLQDELDDYRIFGKLLTKLQSYPQDK